MGKIYTGLKRLAAAVLIPALSVTGMQCGRAGAYLAADMMPSKGNVVVENGEEFDYATDEELLNYSWGSSTFPTHGENMGSLEGVVNEVRRTVSGWGIENMGQYERAKAVHDYLCEKLTYDSSVSGTPGPLHLAMTQGRAVCYGYAALTYMFFRVAGLRAECINSIAEGYQV